jgi:hypothetical protein
MNFSCLENSRSLTSRADWKHEFNKSLLKSEKPASMKRLAGLVVLVACSIISAVFAPVTILIIWLIDKTKIAGGTITHDSAPDWYDRWHREQIEKSRGDQGG